MPGGVITCHISLRKNLTQNLDKLIRLHDTRKSQQAPAQSNKLFFFGYTTNEYRAAGNFGSVQIFIHFA